MCELIVGYGKNLFALEALPLINVLIRSYNSFLLRPQVDFAFCVEVSLQVDLFVQPLSH